MVAVIAGAAASVVVMATEKAPVVVSTATETVDLTEFAAETSEFPIRKQATVRAKNVNLSGCITTK